MSFLQLLKTQTTEQHVALENQLDIGERFKTREDYIKLLERFFTLYAPLEKELEQAADWQQLGWDFEARRKTPWLENDLTALGLSAQDVSALPNCTDLPALTETAQAIGCLYVLEGSTLGGQVITRLLKDSLHISPEEGGRFFAGYREQTVPNWRQFGAWAEGWAAENPDLQPLAVDAARKTFVSFSRWLN